MLISELFFLFICNNDIEKQKYRNTLKGKKNKKLNGYYLDQPYVILIYNLNIISLIIS